MTITTSGVTGVFAMPFSAEAFTFLDISIDHDRAGMRGIDWTYQPAGHRLSFSPWKPSDGGRRTLLLCSDQWQRGFFIRLDAAARKNPHYIRRATAQVLARCTELTAAYEACDGARLRALAADIAAAAAARTKSPQCDGSAALIIAQ